MIKKGGGLTSQPGHLIDLMATCVDVAGAKYPGAPIKPMEGGSLRPIFEGRQRPGHDIYWEHEGNRAVRYGNWKLVSRFPDKWELYNLEADRTELRNLAESEPARVKEMAAMYDAWAARCNVLPWNELKRG